MLVQLRMPNAIVYRSTLLDATAVEARPGRREAPLLGGSRDAGAVAPMTEDEEEEARRLEQQFLLKGIAAAQLQDVVEEHGTSAQRSGLARLELEVDKTLLQLLARECREGEDRGMRALELVRLLRDRSGRMVEAAGKIAERYGRAILGDKIRELGEVRAAGGEEEEDDPF